MYLPGFEQKSVLNVYDGIGFGMPLILLNIVKVNQTIGYCFPWCLIRDDLSKNKNFIMSIEYLFYND